MLTRLAACALIGSHQQELDGLTRGSDNLFLPHCSRLKAEDLAPLGSFKRVMNITTTLTGVSDRSAKEWLTAEHATQPTHLVAPSRKYEVAD